MKAYQKSTRHQKNNNNIYKVNMSPKKVRFKVLAIILVCIPMVISTVYFCYFATERYVSKAQVVVRQLERGQQASMPGLALLMGSSDPASREDTLYLREYIMSHDMLILLDKELGWTKHYAGHTQDPLYWLKESGSLEKKLKFYQRMVNATYDDTTGLLSVEVQAFSAEYAKKIIEEILKRSEIFVNAISKTMATKQLEFASDELISSTERYEASKDKMLAFQNKHNLLDAEAAAASIVGIVNVLESEITTANAHLKALSSTLTINAPQIRAQRNLIQALEHQLEVEKGRITSSQLLDGSLNIIASEYRRLRVEAAIAEEFYKTSLTVVENAKLEATKNIRNLIEVIKPNLPEEAIYPRRVYNLIMIFIALCLLYGISRFIIASIEDHRE